MNRPLDCHGGMSGWFFGHKFKARYNYGPPTIELGKMRGHNVAAGAVKMMEASKAKTYIGDVCVRCGVVGAVAKTKGGH